MSGLWILTMSRLRAQFWRSRGHQMLLLALSALSDSLTWSSPLWVPSAKHGLTTKRKLKVKLNLVINYNTGSFIKPYRDPVCKCTWSPQGFMKWAGVYIFCLTPPPAPRGGGSKTWQNIMLGKKMIERGWQKGGKCIFFPIW